MVSTFLLLASVAPDGSLRLITFLVFISKLLVIFWLPLNNNTVERSTEPPPPALPDGPHEFLISICNHMRPSTIKD